MRVNETRSQEELIALPGSALAVSRSAEVDRFLGNVRRERRNVWKSTTRDRKRHHVSRQLNTSCQRWQLFRAVSHDGNENR